MARRWWRNTGRGIGLKNRDTESSGWFFEGDSPREEVFLTGCQANEEVICRPVDILEAPDGRLFVSDDYAGAIYAIAKTP
jgi:glucose/arabinose dehydrogenase